MMSKVQRRQAERHRVHFSVRYPTALDFIVEYAENLSKGGIFVRGAQNLDLRQEVDVDVELPGFGTFAVTAEVVHVLQEDRAVALGRKPGAGMAIKNSPPDFNKALGSYLEVLGKRKDRMVFASDDKFICWLKDAGFQTAEAPPPSQLAESVSGSRTKVVAAVVSSDRELEYLAAMEQGKLEINVFGIDHIEEIENLLPWLDGSL